MKWCLFDVKGRWIGSLYEQNNIVWFVVCRWKKTSFTTLYTSILTM